MANNYFTQATNESDLKAQYSALYKANFKDATVMAAINSELKEAIAALSNPKPQTPGKTKELSEESKQAIAKAAIFAKSLGLKTELVGSWLWTTGGDTKAAKDKLKAYGFHWSQKHMCWRYTTDKYFKIHSNKSKPEIYTKYQAVEI